MQISEYAGQKETTPEPAFELDQKNKKLLYLLSHNARFKIKDLAHSLKISEDAVKYRMKNLVDQKVITGFTIVFNRRKVGYESVDVYLKVRNLSAELISKLRGHQHVYWLATAEGEFNLALSTNCQNLMEVQELILFIRKYTGANIEDIMFLPLYYEHSSPHAYLVEGLMNKPEVPNFERNENSFHHEFEKREVYNPRSHEPYRLKEIEKKILDILIRDSRTSFYDISLKVHRSVNNVKKIITNLIKNNVIIQFEPKISTPLFGYHWGLFFIQFKEKNEEQRKELLTYLKRKHYSHWFSYIVGKYDLILSLHAKDKEEVLKIKNRLFEKFPELIEKIDQIKIDRQFKHMQVFLD